MGLRICEVLGLRWEDIRFEAGTLSVFQALERSGGDAEARRPLIARRRALRAALAASEKRSEERRAIRQQLAELRVEWRKVATSLRFVEPKSARSRRTIRMPAIVVAALKTHRTRQLKERLAAGGDWQDAGLVFTTPIGSACDSRNTLRAFKAILKAAKLPDIRLHDLRHSCATLLLVQGVNPRVVQEVLGHSAITLTLGTYSHVLPALAEEAAAKLDAALTR
jgi:integrase